MKAEYKDFIGVFSDVYPKGFCEHFIADFERQYRQGVGNYRSNSGSLKHLQDDYEIFVNGNNIDFQKFNGEDTRHILMQGLQQCFDAYSKEFSTLQNIAIRTNFIKLQKTSPHGGYHNWHHEQGNGLQSNRSLVYMLYLNSLPKEANGETEFLYQQRRINPVENTLLIWPAGHTHVHRGNAVYGDNYKYIVTGWFYNE